MTAPAATRFADPAVILRVEEEPLVAELVRPVICSATEWLLLLGFDSHGRLVSACESGGTACGSARLTPAMVRAAMIPGVGGQLLLAHNHPSGELHPSAADIKLTRQLAQLCQMAGLKLYDHLIVSDAGHFSLRAAGLL